MLSARAACLRFQWWACRTFRMTLRSSSRVAWRVIVFSEIGPSKLMSRIEIFLLARHQVAADDFFVAQDHVALDQVLEFADVARPVILLQHGHQVAGKRPGAAVVLAVVVLEEIGDQVRNVALAARAAAASADSRR